jgi:hypothetical protein
MTAKPSSSLLPFALCLLPFAFLSSCGYVGDPLPPTLDIPRRVTDLRVEQRADKVLIDFSIPELTTEGMALRLERVELRAGPYTRAPFDAEAWTAQAKPLDTSGLKSGPAHLELEASAWTGQEVFWRVRLFSHKGRDSGWSEFVTFRVIPPLRPPDGLKAETVADGVRLSWTGPGDATFRIQRRTGKEPPVEVASANGREWLDRDIRYGETYAYSLRSVVKNGRSSVTSDLSAPVTITPVDRFPPAVPQGLAALAASSSIELTWEQNTETDLRGYYVYRAAGDAAFERLGDVREVPTLSDREVKPAARYRYAISSLDRSGNESARSTPVEVSTP